PSPRRGEGRGEGGKLESETIRDSQLSPLTPALSPRGERENRAWNDWPAVVGAMLFAIHPVQVQAVAWVSGLKDVLSGFLALVAVWQYFVGTRRSYVIATIAMFAATLAKPSAMVTPLIVLIIDVLVMKRPLRSSLRSLWIWFALALPAAILTKLAQPPTGVPAAPLWARPLVAMDSLTFYIGKLLLPVGLTVDYGRTPMRVFHGPLFYLSWLVPLIIFGVCMLSRRRPMQYLAACAIFVAGVLPVLGFTPFQYQKISGVADHYIYLSMLGPALAIALFVADHPTRLVVVAAGILLGMLAVLTVRQTGFWHDDAALFAHNIAINPASGLAHLNLGAALERGGDLDGAEREYREALRIDPNDADATANLSDLLRRRGKT
ncbi:MAG TPA: tetratricopeptide repeat protein, partial [Tepidisphaeraceae bacterium]